MLLPRTSSNSLGREQLGLFVPFLTQKTVMACSQYCQQCKCTASPNVTGIVCSSAEHYSLKYSACTHTLCITDFDGELRINVRQRCDLDNWERLGKKGAQLLAPCIQNSPCSSTGPSDLETCICLARAM